MINLNYTKFNDYLNERVTDSSKRKYVASIALAIAISQIIPIPSTATDSAESHYNSSIKDSVRQMVSNFNENVVVDINLCLETVRAYWMVRYFCAHPDNTLSLMAQGEYGFLAKLTNTAKFFNPQTYSICERNSDVIISLINRIKNILLEKSN